MMFLFLFLALCYADVISFLYPSVDSDYCQIELVSQGGYPAGTGVCTFGWTANTTDQAVLTVFKPDESVFATVGGQGGLVGTNTGSTTFPAGTASGVYVVQVQDAKSVRRASFRVVAEVTMVVAPVTNVRGGAVVAVQYYRYPPIRHNVVISYSVNGGSEVNVFTGSINAVQIPTKSYMPYHPDISFQ